ncbi:hypothetical protein B0H16DRAFT_1591723 [Mycena metata]|uniref:Uncharacterized protein n=1 Tax=Mycena metata TaxID=1033252 RepID=A0AAD7HRW0_9AGAR|nr:hypothetical protein B0H16DRAFT_1591723 [Mycena metata]
MAAAFLPLALTLLATASLFGPASVLSRAIRRVVPAADAALPPEDQNAAAKAADSLCTLLLRALAFVLRVQFPTIFRGQDENILPETPVSSQMTDNSPANVEAPKVDVDTVESASISAAVETQVLVDGLDSNTDAAPATPPPRPAQCETALRRTYVDFTIGWDDIWPERQCSAPRKYIYNSCYNAYTLSASLEPLTHSSNASDPSSHEDVGTDSDRSSDGDSDSEIDALELASRSEDDDLIWAFHSLSISNTLSSDSRPPYSPSPPIPPAGLSPFCPPPLPTPSPPPQPSTAWRLEWY